uniref:Uncharacterized protein n=1 Tax=virus sp. ctyMK1 TaxID=2828002 RepID=A0A8S5RED5_9VIRU|nr:MAG TPA: hypothetical protein [virus sp. ctyMK1]
MFIIFLLLLCTADYSALSFNSASTTMSHPSYFLLKILDNVSQNKSMFSSFFSLLSFITFLLSSH